MEPISGATLGDLREFFLDHVYPVSDERDRLDNAFESLGEIIHSPKRLMPLMTTALRTVWKLGRMFPSAVAAAKNTLEAYLGVRKLEDVLVDFAKRHKFQPDDIRDHSVMVRMFASVSESEMTRFRNEMLSLMRHLADTNLLKATVEIMKSSKRVMESRPDLYDEDELAGFRLGLDILERGLELFQSLDPDEVEPIIRGIEEVEIDWYHRIKAEAATLEPGA